MGGQPWRFPEEGGDDGALLGQGGEAGGPPLLSSPSSTTANADNSYSSESGASHSSLVARSAVWGVGGQGEQRRATCPASEACTHLASRQLGIPLPCPTPQIAAWCDGNAHSTQRRVMDESRGSDLQETKQIGSFACIPSLLYIRKLLPIIKPEYSWVIGHNP